MNINLEGKRALVTGGNSGIGEAVVRELADAGATVGINYVTRPEAAEKVVAEIREKHGKATALHADISDPGAVSAMFKEIDAEWNGIDILVNNAGIDGSRAFGWDADIGEWRRVIEINLFGAFYCSRQALKRMVPNKSGVIINISSVHEIVAWSGYSAYTASKAGVGMMARTLAQEAAPHGVRVVSVGPGAIKTPINRSVWDNPDSLRDLLEKIPIKRMGEASDIGRMVVVLASDVASYVTGRTIYVDGGMTDYPDFAHGG
ncbi:MAG: SDR family oxidoreductase [Candidatus Sulfobium sp.]|jgi:glucose 1-dehydrogenase